MFLATATLAQSAAGGGIRDGAWALTKEMPLLSHG